jgi:predicted alpha/beta hydrolase
MVPLPLTQTVLLSHPEASDLELYTRDNFSLAGRLWAVPGTRLVENVALINAGAGIASGYYDRFAAFLAENRIPTLVYDYRGIGRSRPKSLRGFQASVEEWGSKDCAAALEWLRNRYPRARRIVVGHSIGGFVTGFVTNGTLIDKMLLLSAHTGYWRDYAASVRPLMFMLWHVLMPAITRFVGYFPGRRLHLLEDLPKGVALEWAERLKPEFWWHLQLADGSLDTNFVEALRARFSAIRARTLAVRFTDDPFATAEATERILGLYRNASVFRLVLSAADGDGRKIGHFGFFNSRFRATLWPRVLEALLARD